MQFGVDTLQVHESHLLLQDHLVEGSDEVGIQEPAVEDAQTQTATDELEVVQMFRVDARGRVDLKSVVVVCGGKRRSRPMVLEVRQKLASGAQVSFVAVCHGYISYTCQRLQGFARLRWPSSVYD